MNNAALVIAKKTLSRCETSSGLVAGVHHFVDLWARDSLFASFGASPPIAMRTLDTFFRYQRTDGAIPYRIFHRIGRYWQNFRSVQSGGFVPDGGLMAIIAAKQYEKKYFLQIQQAKNFYTSRYGTSLISEWFQCEWADAVLKMGKVLYTNILYWKAMENGELKKRINDTFWNGSFFSDWVDYKRQDYFASHPNMLAIVWGLTTLEQAEKILAHAKHTCWNGWALEENYPAYPPWRIPVQNYLAGIPDYHNRGVIWLQPTILYAMALFRVGQKKEAKEVFQIVTNKILEYNGIYEVYEKRGEPVARPFYRSEHPFSWSAGLYIWAYRECFAR